MFLERLAFHCCFHLTLDFSPFSGLTSVRRRFLVTRPQCKDGRGKGEPDRCA